MLVTWYIQSNVDKLKKILYLLYGREKCKALEQIFL